MTEQLVATAVKGRVGHSRQVPPQRIAADSILSTNLEKAIEEAFRKYSRHGIYAVNWGISADRDEAYASLFCNKTDNKLAELTITKEKNA